MKLKEVKKTELKWEKFYLVKCPNWCECGFDIAQADGEELISQSNGSNLMTFAEKFYEIPS